MSTQEPKRKRDTSKKRQHILNTAIDVFSNNGFEGTSMDKIAQEAKVSKITIYKHFESKENLFLEIVSEFLKDSSKKKPLTYQTDQSLESQLMAFIEAEIFLIQEPRERAKSKLLTSVYLFKVDFVLKTMAKHPFHVDFMNWLNMAKADRKLEFESAQLTAQMFYGLIEGCITWNALLTDGQSLKTSEPLIKEIIQVFLARYASKTV